MANTKTLNSIFGRTAVMSARPDAYWPLPLDFIGVEIEVENYSSRDSYNALAPEWTQHVDHSLRNGVEFVTSAPAGGETLTAAINKFFTADHSYDTGPRTSIHIHINASDNMNVDQFRNMLALIYVIEPAVFRWADENRKWCGYCAPLTDIVPSRFVTILNENNNDAELVKAIRGENNHDRYFGFNMAAYAKHGTVEFRYFPCTRERELVEKWIKFVMYVKKTALRYDSIPAMLNAMDGDTELRLFIEDNFGDVASDLYTHIDVLDSLSRVRDILSAAYIKPVGPKKKLFDLPSVANPQLQAFFKKTFPDRKDLIVDPSQTKAKKKTTAAHDLFHDLLDQGVDDLRAYQQVVNLGVPARQAASTLQEVRAERAEREEAAAIRARTSVRYEEFLAQASARTNRPTTSRPVRLSDFNDVTWAAAPPSIDDVPNF